MELFANNASSFITASITSASTTIPINTGDGVLFPSTSQYDPSQNFFYATLESGSAREIIAVVDSSTTADVFIVNRGQQGTTALNFPISTSIENRLTSNGLSNFVQESAAYVMSVQSDPTPPSYGLNLYAYNVVGRIMPKWVGPSGLNTPIQPALFSNCVYMWQPSTATAGLWIGTAGAGGGTYTTSLPTTTTIYTSMKRAVYKSVITTVNQTLGQHNTEKIWFIGSNPNQGGFMFVARFGIENWTNGNRLFAGLATTITPMTANPSVLTNAIGFGVDSGSAVISFMHNSATGVATTESIAGQPTIAVNQGYDAYFWCAPSSSTVYWRLDDINAQSIIATGSTSIDMPVANTTMYAMVNMGNSANTSSANLAGIGINRIYLETDK